MRKQKLEEGHSDAVAKAHAAVAGANAWLKYPRPHKTPRFVSFCFCLQNYTSKTRTKIDHHSMWYVSARKQGEQASKQASKQATKQASHVRNDRAPCGKGIFRKPMRCEQCSCDGIHRSWSGDTPADVVRSLLLKRAALRGACETM